MTYDDTARLLRAQAKRNRERAKELDAMADNHAQTAATYRDEAASLRSEANEHEEVVRTLLSKEPVTA